ncbi:MAG: hypothetical protein ACODAQ_13080, partial [Phycisphaeraceae bacterium]
MRRWLASCGMAVVVAVAGSAAVAAPIAGGGGPNSALLADWEVTDDPAPVSGYRPAPFLSDSNAAEVDAFLSAQPGSVPRVVKVVEDLSPEGPAVQLFDEHRIDYVFADYESSDSA